MNPSHIVFSRLQNQHLIGEKCKTAEHVVRHLGAVQAQDYAAAKWGIGLRMIDATDTLVEDAFNKGTIIRTHIMRPTWHFILPENLIWMQKVTAHRVKQLLTTYNKKLDLTEEVFKKTNTIITRALKGNTYLHRQEIKKILDASHITTDVQRLSHIVMWAELEGLICSGPRKGKQFTYALVEERIHTSKQLDHDESLARFALMYFTSHGPAQLKDFAWWSGLTVKESCSAIDMISSQLERETFEDKTYWFSSHTTKSSYTKNHTAHLVSIFDEYTIAYKDRSVLGGQRYIEKLLSMGNLLTAVVLIDGLVVGTWKRVLKKKSVEISIIPLRPLSQEETQLICEEGEKYGKFMRLQSEIYFKSSKLLNMS